LKLYSKNISDATITYTGTPDTDFPLDNLYDPEKYTIFKDTSVASGVSVKIDFGSGEECDSIVLGSLIATSGVTCTLYGSNDDISYSAVTTISTGATATDTLKEFTQATWRYWRLTFTTVGSFTILQIGNIFLGNKLELSHNPELIGTAEGLEYQGTVSKTITGYKSGKQTQTDPIKTYSYRYEGCSDTEKTSIEGVGDDIVVLPSDYSANPFYFYQDELVCARHIGKFSFEKIAYDNHTINFNFETEL